MNLRASVSVTCSSESRKFSTHFAALLLQSNTPRNWWPCFLMLIRRTPIAQRRWRSRMRPQQQGDRRRNSPRWPSAMYRNQRYLRQPQSHHRWLKWPQRVSWFREKYCELLHYTNATFSKIILSLEKSAESHSVDEEWKQGYNDRWGRTPL